MPSSFAGGPHELGQNFLVDRRVIEAVEDLVARTTGPLVEIGPDDGALTRVLSRSERPLTAVEIDPGRAQRLRRRTPGHVTVLNEDVLSYRLPHTPHVVG